VDRDVFHRVFIVGIAMFGMIIYLPLFMQGVLGVTATRSGNLLTPLMLGIVAVPLFAVRQHCDCAATKYHQWSVQF
jgi:hypothetical protein